MMCYVQNAETRSALVGPCHQVYSPVTAAGDPVAPNPSSIRPAKSRGARPASSGALPTRVKEIQRRLHVQNAVIKCLKLYSANLYSIVTELYIYIWTMSNHFITFIVCLAHVDYFKWPCLLFVKDCCIRIHLARPCRAKLCTCLEMPRGHQWWLAAKGSARERRHEVLAEAPRP